jgi:hypothetical protein
MKKAIITLALLSPLAMVNNAMSFPTGEEFDIEVEGSDVGTVEARNRVRETSRYCEYTLMWVNDAPPLSRTTRCDIRETKASNDFDCEENRDRWVTSLIQRGSSCTGFDEFGQQTRVSTITGGESRRGGVVGVFYASSIGDFQNFSIDD